MKEYYNQTFTGDGLYLHEPAHISNCKFYNIEGFNHHGMELHGDGKGIEYIVEDCVFDNDDVNPKNYDEGCAIINAPIVTFNRCRFTHLGKACLVGNGDHNEADRNLRVTFNNCIFENCGRRSPYIQFGEAILNDCIIRDWGDPSYFYTKSFGLRVGPAAKCTVNRTAFIQHRFFPGFINFFTDVFNQYDPILIPGNFRSAYAETGGKLFLNDCYFSSRLLYKNAPVNNNLDIDWDEHIEKIEGMVPYL